MVGESELLERITVRADIFGGKPIIRNMRFAVEHVLEMLAAGDTAETILDEYPILEPEDIQACLVGSIIWSFGPGNPFARTPIVTVPGSSGPS